MDGFQALPDLNKVNSKVAKPAEKLLAEQCLLEGMGHSIISLIIEQCITTTKNKADLAGPTIDIKDFSCSP